MKMILLFSTGFFRSEMLFLKKFLEENGSNEGIKYRHCEEFSNHDYTYPWHVQRKLQNKIGNSHHWVLKHTSLLNSQAL